MRLDRYREDKDETKIDVEPTHDLPLYCLPAFPKGLPDTWIVTEESKRAFEAGQASQGYAVILWQDIQKGGSTTLFVSLIPAFNKDDFLPRNDKSGKPLVPAELFEEKVEQVYFIESDFPLGQNTGDIHTKSVEHLKRSGQMSLDHSPQQIFGAGVFKGNDKVLLFQFRNRSLSLNKHSVHYHPLFLAAHYYDSFTAPKEVRGCDRVDHLKRTLPPDFSSLLCKTLLEQLPHQLDCARDVSVKKQCVFQECFDWWHLNKHNKRPVVEKLTKTLEIAIFRNSCSSWIKEILNLINDQLKHLPESEAAAQRTQVLNFSSRRGLDIASTVLDQGDSEIIQLFLDFANKEQIYEIAIIDAKIKAIRIFEDTQLINQLLSKFPNSLENVIEFCIRYDDADCLRKLFKINPLKIGQEIILRLGHYDYWHQLPKLADFIYTTFPMEQKDCYGNTLIHVAAKLETSTALNTLLAKDDSFFNVKNQKEDLPIYLAAGLDRLDNLVILLEKYREKGIVWEGVDPKEALHNLALFAAKNCCPKVTFFLYCKESNPEKRLQILRILFESALQNNNLGLMAQIQAKMPDAFKNSQLLFDAVNQGNPALLNFVLDEEKDKRGCLNRADEKKQTILHIAVNLHKEYFLERLLKKDSHNLDWEQKDVNGDTPLTLILKQLQESPPYLKVLLVVIHHATNPEELIAKLLATAIINNKCVLVELILNEISRAKNIFLVDILLQLPMDFKLPPECVLPHDAIQQSIIGKIKEKHYFEDKKAILDEICQNPIMCSLLKPTHDPTLFSKPSLLSLIENLRIRIDAAPKRNKVLTN